jgi:hypothetical protein
MATRSCTTAPYERLSIVVVSIIMRRCTPKEDQPVVDAINAARPDIVWLPEVGEAPPGKEER